MRELHLFKYIVPRPNPAALGVSYSGFVWAYDAAHGRELLREYAARNGLRSAWLDVATVQEITADEGPRVLGWAQT